MTISTAFVEWRYDHQGKKVPVSRQFDDVYFSNASGLQESNYVFLQQNQLPARFADTMQKNGVFVIAETGFGTGLNFLATCVLWQRISADYPNHQASLQFISTERYPLTLDDLKLALEGWRGDNVLLDYWINRLIAQYPLPVAGCHRRAFGSITLDLWLADASDSLTTLSHSTAQKIDAWFLDGFSPKKNAQMWSDTLFFAIKQLSKKDTTLATFSCAGVVKRKLTAIGATLKKTKGFGHKREMLSATFEHLPATPSKKAATALVIGAGIAGLSTAYQLARRGAMVTLIDKQAPLAQASGNPCALLSPKLYDYRFATHRLPLVSFLYSQAFYHTLPSDKNQPIFCQTGVIDALLPTKKSADELAKLIAPYPKTLVHRLHPSQIPDNPPIKHDRFWAVLPNTGQVIPKRFAKAVLDHPNIRFVKADIKTISQHGCAITENGDALSADCVVVCAGVDSYAVNTDELGHTIYKTRHIRGQVSFCPIDTPVAPWSVKYDGYACVFNDEGKSTLLFGASFIRDSHDCTTNPKEHHDNLAKLSQALHLCPTTPLHGRASIRSQTPDYHPMVGALTPTVWLHTALGSKGFGFAPFCAEIVASALMGELPCATTDLLDRLSPHRERLKTPLDTQANRGNG